MQISNFDWSNATLRHTDIPTVPLCDPGAARTHRIHPMQTSTLLFELIIAWLNNSTLSNYVTLSLSNSKFKQKMWCGSSNLPSIEYTALSFGPLRTTLFVKIIHYFSKKSDPSQPSTSTCQTVLNQQLGRGGCFLKKCSRESTGEYLDLADIFDNLKYATSFLRF